MPEPSQDQDIPGSHAANSGLQAFACAVRQTTAAAGTGSEWRIVRGDTSYSALVSKSRVASSPALPDVWSSVQRTWSLNLAALWKRPLATRKTTTWDCQILVVFVCMRWKKRWKSKKLDCLDARLWLTSPLNYLTSEPTKLSEVRPHPWNLWETNLLH